LVWDAGLLTCTDGLLTCVRWTFDVYWSPCSETNNDAPESTRAELDLEGHAGIAEIDSREVAPHLGLEAPVVPHAAHRAEVVVPAVDGRLFWTQLNILHVDGRLILDLDGRLIILDVVGRFISDEGFGFRVSGVPPALEGGIEEAGTCTNSSLLLSSLELSDTHSLSALNTSPPRRAHVPPALEGYGFRISGVPPALEVTVEEEGACVVPRHRQRPHLLGLMLYKRWG